MDHGYIDEFDLVDRYLRGKLAAEESALFEEHFVDCPQCVGRLKTTRDFLQGMRLVASEQTSKRAGQTPARPFWHPLQILSRRPLALAVSIFLVAVAIGAILAVVEVRRLRSNAQQAKDDSAEWERRYEEERQNAQLSDSEHQNRERALTERLEELESKLQSKQGQEPAAPGHTGRWMQPSINLPIFTLNSAKRGGQPSSEEINQIPLPASPTDFVISLGLEGESGHKDYQVAIFDADNRLIWRRGGFRRDRYNSLSIGFNSTFFRPGNYLLTVEGSAAGGGAQKVGNYPLRIIKGS